MRMATRLLVPLARRLMVGSVIKSVLVARGNGGANHQPRLNLRPLMPPMHRGAVVPQSDVASSPVMDIGVRVMRGLLHQPRQERPALPGSMPSIAPA